MERDIVWSSTMVNFRTFVFQYFHMQYILFSCAGKSAEFLLDNLEQSLNNNYMKVNTGKIHLLLSGNSGAITAIDNSYIELTNEQVLLGITIYSNVAFENHINSICKKASQKLDVLARIAPYMNIKKQRTTMKSFVTSKFSSYPLIWMFNFSIQLLSINLDV